MRTTASLGWRALPECPICGTPTRRAVFDANGGTCTACRGVVGDLEAADSPVQLDLVQWQALAARRGAEERAKAASRVRRRRERRRG